MNIKYIDIHCHLDFKDYDADRNGVFGRMRERGVGAITIGTDLESSKKAVEIVEANENIWACIGVHPNEAGNELWSKNYELWEELVKSPKVVGIGECGLDYFRIHSPNIENEKKRQKELFKSQIEFASKYDKALMLHCRPARNALAYEAGGEAYDEVLDILESYKKAEGPEAEKLKGNAHFFAWNIEQAKRFLDLGFSLSFTGVITFADDYN